MNPDTPRQQTILIVEDETAIRKALVDSLSREGFAILEAEDGEIGLSIAMEENPDLILLDAVMPNMDGLTMLHKLHEKEEGRKIGVIMLTNLSENETVRAAMREGIYDYLVKTNWKLEDLITKINEYLACKK